MTTHATATFSIKSWDEKTWAGKPHNEVTGPKLTRAEIAYNYEGDFSGESSMQYLMYYRPDEQVSCVALERMDGTLGGRRGSFVLQHNGLVDGHSITGDFTIIPSSGTGELAGIQGNGKLYATDKVWQITFDYDFA